MLSRFVPIIVSLLDTDQYKLTMLQAYFLCGRFADVFCEWKYKLRRPPAGLNMVALIPQITEQIEHLCALRFTDHDMRYLQSRPYFRPAFLDFLRLWQPQKRFIELRAGKNGDIELRFRGPLLQVMMLEIYLLSIVQEVYTRSILEGMSGPAAQAFYEEGRKRLYKKIALVKAHPLGESFRFSEGGTRRRHSRAWHGEVLDILRHELPAQLAGTSNLYYAREMGLVPIGTQGHEWYQAWQSLARLEEAQTAALQAWVDVYRGDPGIALTDCYSHDAFMRDFDRYFAKLFDGARQDSGDEVRFGERQIAHYQALRIDPTSKVLVFSNSLDFGSALDLHAHFHGRIREAACLIGTKIVNDLDLPALNMVIKMVSCNGRPVAKISDEPEKSMCEDPEYLRRVAVAQGIDPALLPEVVA